MGDAIAELTTAWHVANVEGDEVEASALLLELSAAIGQAQTIGARLRAKTRELEEQKLQALAPAEPPRRRYGARPPGLR
jgi:hypothetical protein